MKRNWGSFPDAFKIFSIVLVALPFAVVTLADENPKPSWSVSLQPQGYRRNIFDSENSTRVGGVVVTKETVGVALGNDPHSGVKHTWRGPWEVVVLLYEAKTGKFLSRKGPWSSGSGFNLVPTSAGNFLLFLSPIVDGTRYTPGKLMLLSGSGEELKELQFDFKEQIPKPGGIQFYRSPSGRTVLIAARWAGEVRYEVLNADSLQVSLDWVEPEDHGKGVPWIRQISDDQMLGTTGLNSYHLRVFGGEWKVLPLPGPEWKVTRNNPFEPNSPGFLQDHVLVGRAYETKDDFVFPIYQEGGAQLSRHATRKLPDYNFFRMPPIVSQDGQYFAIRLMHENKLTHWWDADVDMDATGADYFLYVWQRETASPMASIKVGRYVAAVSFFPEGIPEIAIVDGDKLKVFLLPANPFPGEKSLH